MRKPGRMFATTLLVLAMATTVGARFQRARPSPQHAAPQPAATYVDGDVARVEAGEIWIEPSNRSAVPVTVTKSTRVAYGSKALRADEIRVGDHATARIASGVAEEIRLARARAE
jgi:hypothetical protein